MITDVNRADWLVQQTLGEHLEKVLGWRLVRGMEGRFNQAQVKVFILDLLNGTPLTVHH